MTRARSSPERGATSLLLVAVFVFGLMLVLGSARLGAALIATARAQAAADAAALAAADALALGRGVDRATADAADTAVANDARLERCRCDGPRVRVTVVFEVGVLGRRARANATAEVIATIVPPP